MNFVKLTPVFNIRVVYKSGYTHDFEVTEFKISPTECSWKLDNPSNTPLRLGIDDVAAVWQIGVRHKLKFG